MLLSLRYTLQEDPCILAPLTVIIHAVNWTTTISPFSYAGHCHACFTSMRVGRTPCTHSKLIRCRPYLLHHRPHHPRLDQVQTVPLTPLTTSSLPYSCRPYPLHGCIEQRIIRRQTSTMPPVDHHCRLSSSPLLAPHPTDHTAARGRRILSEMILEVAL